MRNGRAGAAGDAVDFGVIGLTELFALHGGHGSDPVLTARLPTLTEGVEVADALAWERRNSYSGTGGYGTRPAVVIGAYDPATFEAEAFSSTAKRHAEGVATDAMPDALLSKPISVRKGDYIPVCEPCEAEFGRLRFPADTTFAKDIK